MKKIKQILTAIKKEIMSNTRKTCLPCVLKHLGQAIVLLGEVEKGYPHHKFIALGHLAEAEDESVNKHPKISEQIRKTRLSIQDKKTAQISIEDLIIIVDKINQSEGGGCGSC